MCKGPAPPPFYPKQVLQEPRGWGGGGAGSRRPREQNCPTEQAGSSEILGVDFRQKFTALLKGVI